MRPFIWVKNCLAPCPIIFFTYFFSNSHHRYRLKISMNDYQENPCLWADLFIRKSGVSEVNVCLEKSELKLEKKISRWIIYPVKRMCWVLYAAFAGEICEVKTYPGDFIHESMGYFAILKGWEFKIVRGAAKVEWTYSVHPVARKFSHLGAKTITNHGNVNFFWQLGVRRKFILLYMDNLLFY